MNEEINIEGQQIVVTGHRGAGKSTFVQTLIDAGPPALVIDTNREHTGYNRYLPEYRRGEEGKAEIDGVVERAVMNNDPERRPGHIVIEEANRYVPNRGTIPPAVGELVDLGRHYETAVSDGITVTYVTRRPSQLDTDVMELADYLVVYRSRGKNDKKRLNQEADGLGDAAGALDDYHYILVRPDRSYDEMNPVPVGDTTGSI